MAFLITIFKAMRENLPSSTLVVGTCFKIFFSLPYTMLQNVKLVNWFHLLYPKGINRVGSKDKCSIKVTRPPE